MNSIIKSERKLNSFGFTLVELILSLSILAVLLALTVPALLGYVEKTKEKQDLLDAKRVLTLIQAELSEMYALNSDSLEPGEHYIVDINTSKQEKLIREGKIKKNGDVNATIPDKNGITTVDYTQYFAAKILAEAGLVGDPNSVKDDPCCIMFAVGSNWNVNAEYNTQTTLKDKYTVYYLLYMRTKDSKPFFWFNGEWTNSIPRHGKNDNRYIDEYNVIKVGANAGKRIQYYCISNQSDTTFGDNFWSQYAWKLV